VQDRARNTDLDPNAPAGLESNWILTEGKRPVSMFRLYAPQDAYFDKIFNL
jgi:hypothetical protein